MENTHTAEPPRSWRKAKGVKVHVLAEMIRIQLGETQRHPTSITKMERVGTKKSDVIRAYADAVDVPFVDAQQVFVRLANINSTSSRKIVSKKV